MRTSEGGSAGVFACGFAERPRPVFLRAARRGPNPQPGRLRYAAVRPGLTRGSGCCHVVAVMSITVQLDLPDALVDEARNNGLLESASVGDLLLTELRRRKAATLLQNVLERIRTQPGEPMSEEEIAAEVKAARRERRAREAGR